MQYRIFGKTDLKVSEIGFGAWAIGGNAMVGNTPIGWGKADDSVSIQAIHAALDAGINFFDTADFYGLGHSESILGKTLARNKEIIFATKVGHRNVNETIRLDYSKQYILQACEQSLKRLQKDCIDYYQLHSARLEHFEKEACIEAMELLKQQGKIRYWGLSLNTFYPAPEADLLMSRKAGDGFQMVFNIINQKALPVLNKAAENGYGVIARMPLQFGLLTGKFSATTSFSTDDHRSFRLTTEILKASIKTLEEQVWPLCNKYNISKTALAHSFILSYDAVSTVIPGLRTPQQIKDNVTGIVQLNAEDIEHLEKTFSNYFTDILDLMEKQG